MGIKHKISILTLALSGFIASTVAQITEGSQIFGGGSLGELFLGIVDSVTLIPVDTMPVAALFLALTLVFYFAEKNLLEQVFLRLEEIILESFGKSSTSLHGTDEFPTGVKGMAFASAFITSNMLAALLGAGVLWLIMPIAILGLVIILIVKGKILASVFPTQKTGSAAKSSYSSVKSELKSAADYLRDAGGEAQDAADTGNEKEGEHSEKEIQAALELLNEAEGDIAQEFEADREELAQAIKEFNDVWEKKKEVDSELHSEQVQGAMDNARGNLELFLEALKGGNVRKNKQNLDNAAEDFQFLVKLFTNIDHELEEEVPEDKDALNKVIDAADKAVQSHKQVQKLKQLLRKAEKEDEYLEKVAQSRGFKQMYRKAEKEEEEEKQLEEKLEKLEMEDGKLLKQLEKADNILQEHVKMDEDIFNTLQREVNKFPIFGEDNLAKSVNKALRNVSETKDDNEFWRDVEAELIKCKNGMEALKNHAEHIEEIKKNEDMKERKVADNLEQHIKAMTS